MTQAIISQSYTQHDLIAITNSTAKLHLTPLIPKTVQSTGDRHSHPRDKTSGSSSGTESDRSPIVIRTSKRWILPPRPRPGKKTASTSSRTSSDSSQRRSSISRTSAKQHSSSAKSKAKVLGSSRTSQDRRSGSNSAARSANASTNTNCNNSTRNTKRNSITTISTRTTTNRKRSVSSSSKSNTTDSSSSTGSKSRKSSGKVVKAQIPKDVDELNCLAFLNFDDTADLSLGSSTLPTERRSSSDSQITRTGTPPVSKSVCLTKTSSKASGSGTATRTSSSSSSSSSQSREAPTLSSVRTNTRRRSSKASATTPAGDEIKPSVFPPPTSTPMDVILDMSLPMDLNFHLDVPMELQGVSPSSETVVPAAPTPSDPNFPFSKYFGTDVSATTKFDDDLLSSSLLGSKNKSTGNRGSDGANGFFATPEYEAINPTENVAAGTTEVHINRDDAGVEIDSEDELYNSIWELLPRYTDSNDNSNGNIQEQQLRQQQQQQQQLQHGLSTFQQDQQQQQYSAQQASVGETPVLAPTLDELMEEQDNFMDLFNDGGDPDFGNSGSAVKISADDFDFDFTKIGSL